MKNKVILTLLMAVFAISNACAKEYKYESVKGDPMKARIYTLDNGLKVYISVNSEKPRLQTYIAVRTGSRNDPAETTGLAHYLEHLMFKGTQKFGTTNYEAEKPYLDQIRDKYEVYRTLTDAQQRKQCYHEIDSLSQLAAQYNIPNEYDKMCASMGAQGTNAFTSNDVTCYVNDIPCNELEKWMKEESDRFQNMVIRGFHTELEAVYEEYNIGLGSDGRKEWEALYKEIFPTHPYGTQSTIGTQAHLKNPSIVNIENYFHRYYCPNNIAICLAGDIDPDKTIALVDKYFGMWKPNPQLSQPQYAPVAELTQPRDTTVVGKEAENIMMGWKFDGCASMQNDTLTVVSEMLSNGKAGLFDLDLDQKMEWLGGGTFVDGLAEYTVFGIEAMPKEGQPLDDLRKLILCEIGKLQDGDFSDDLLVAVKNNMKLEELRKLDSNRNRASEFMDAFICHKDWKDVVTQLSRIEKLTKQDIMDFARRHLRDNNYAIVYKMEGTDSTQVKIDKPQITPIPANREYQSDFVKAFVSEEAEPIQPQFIDFQKDMSKGVATKAKLPVLYVQNTQDDRFTLCYRYDFGEKADKWYDYADYLDYLGTDKLSAEELKMKFYKLACSYSISVSNDCMYISLSGLKENMPEAMKLMEDFLDNAKADKEAWDKLVGLAEKARQDEKLNQRSNFSALRKYGSYGAERDNNPQLHTATIDEMKQKNPEEITRLFDDLSQYKHTLLYYGPLTLKDFEKVAAKYHKADKQLRDAPQFTDYKQVETPENEVILAPYEAKNIYMVMYNNHGKQWTKEEEPVAEVFNEYFGGGMNTVVFQELRETRALAYSAFAQYVTPSKKNDPEWAMTYIISQNDKMPDCVRTFQNILDTIPQNDASLNLAKQSLRKSIASERTQKMGIIWSYLYYQKRGLDEPLNRYVYENLDGVTMQQVADFEKKTMAQKPWKYLILGDEKELDMDYLKTLGPVKHVTTEEIFGY